MSPQQIVGMSVRLFAIWLALTGLPYVWAIPAALERQHVDGRLVPEFIGLVLLLVALLLWLFPMVVAHKLVPRTTFNNVLRAPALDAARVGCFVVGLWYFLKSAPALVSFLFRAFLVSGSGSLFGSMDLEQKLDFWFYVIEIAISLFLIARNELIASWVMGSRSASSSREAP
jgi:hypothetical protein